MLRGGAFVDGPVFLRCAARLDNFPVSRLVSYGFRVVVSPFL
jgi:formylglycine-generating enzyme required for sulfatase activity